MSAITGIYHVNNDPINIKQGWALMKELEKYPVDSAQIWHNEKVFLGCHAQWITPESVGEQIPYYDCKRQLAITADAIIDNREELFERLQIDRAYRKKITDSELILLSYQKWGEDSPKYLVGDFAFMIWDEKKQQLFGARDPSGYRTLYYYRNPSRFAFCTTIDPLLSLPYVKGQLNEQWLAEFLAITGMIDTVDARTTPYCDIEQVPPFHSIVIGRDKIELSRYGVFFSGDLLKLKSNEEYVEAFQEVFQQAVSCRIRTHRNIGAQLSGGLDSGSVVGFAAKAMREENKPLHTFSYIPPSDFADFTPKQLIPDERPFIQSTVQYIGGIKDQYLDFEGSNSYSEIDDFLETMEMPYKFFENSFWLKGMFEKAHEERIGVLLNGDRGNWTISWGSSLDYYAILLKRLKWLRLFQELNQYSRKVGGARLRNLPLIASLSFPIINQILSQEKMNKLPSLIDPGLAERTGVLEKLKAYGIGETGWVSISNIYEERRGLLENIFPWNAGNTLTSKLSLRYSLWKRDPTNDIRVVRFCLSLPEDQFVQNGLDRALIRRATENILPDEVRLNQRIRGVQGVDWVHRMIPHWGSLEQELKQLSLDKEILRFLNGQLIEEVLLSVKQGPKPEMATNSYYKTAMRILILYRFLKKMLKRR